MLFSGGFAICLLEFLLRRSAQMDADLFAETAEAPTALGRQLIRAVLDGKDAKTIQHFLEAGAPIWYQDEEEGMSALHAAAYAENPEIVALLIEQGAIWNAGACASWHGNGRVGGPHARSAQ